MSKFFLLLLLSLNLYATDDESAVTLSFGPMVIGEERIPISLKDFPVFVDGGSEKKTLPIRVQWIENSVQWIRLKNNLMLPRARLSIESDLPAGQITLHYLDKVISLQEFTDEGGHKRSKTELYFSLFHPGLVNVSIEGISKGSIQIRARPQSESQKIEISDRRQLIDYSCAPYLVEVKGMDGEFFSASCQMIRIGKMGEEEPMLEVYWTCVNCKMLDGSTPPFTAVFRDSNSVVTSVKDSQNKIRNVELLAKIPTRLKRFKISGGFGPYSFTAQKESNIKSTAWAPSAMLYANFYLADDYSFRGFDAAVSKNPSTGAFFNNFGIYFAYEIGKAFDKRIQAVALLGFQGLTFAYNGLRGTTFSQAIFPQGFEVTYLHAFGIKNSVLGYGMFILPTKENNYKNIWIRFGKRTFGEVNYISWNYKEMSAATWGASVGFPIGGMF